MLRSAVMDEVIIVSPHQFVSSFALPNFPVYSDGSRHVTGLTLNISTYYEHGALHLPRLARSDYVTYIHWSRNFWTAPKELEIYIHWIQTALNSHTGTSQFVCSLRHSSSQPTRKNLSPSTQSNVGPSSDKIPVQACRSAVLQWVWCHPTSLQPAVVSVLELGHLVAGWAKVRPRGHYVDM